VRTGSCSLLDLQLIPPKSFIRALRELQKPLPVPSNQRGGAQWTDTCFTTIVDLPSAFEDGIEVGGYGRLEHVQMDDLHRAGEACPGRRELGEPHERVDYHRRLPTAEVTVPIESSAQEAVVCQI
jgi:hypothetical protein